jgi:hypothetical protein
MVEDYEAIIVPLTELLFTVAQLPRGIAAQQSFYAHLTRLGALLEWPVAARRGAWRVASAVAKSAAVVIGRLQRRTHAANDHRLGTPSPTPANGRELPGFRACDPSAPASIALEAFAQVACNHGWSEHTDRLVFAHTHQPLDGACDAGQRARFWNTGSWIDDPPRRSTVQKHAYSERAWPGTGILIDTTRSDPQVVAMLGHYAPSTLEREARTLDRGGPQASRGGQRSPELRPRVTLQR